MSTSKSYDLIVIGGGAAGFYAAIHTAELQPNWRILILERGKSVLQKVKISGGGRCNVTHACFDPAELVKHYPRGERALRGPFSRYQPSDTIDWFSRQGVALKTEEDGRMFPTSDDSQTIIDTFWKCAKKSGVEVRTQSAVDDFFPKGAYWKLHLRNGSQLYTKNVLIATGSNAAIWKKLGALGLPMVEPVPSLFTFNTKDTRLRQLAGVSVPFAALEIEETKLKANGPLLITHWGLSGPAVLRLSAWGARVLAKAHYEFTLRVNWLGSVRSSQIQEEIQRKRADYGNRQLNRLPLVELPRRLWENLLCFCQIDPKLHYAELSRKQIMDLEEVLLRSRFTIRGKSTFKEEFVTAGGVDLDAVNLKTFSAKDFPNLYLAGEVLNIDGITGGFNFQAAWTGAWHVAQALGKVKD